MGFIKNGYRKIAEPLIELFELGSGVAAALAKTPVNPLGDPLVRLETRSITERSEAVRLFALQRQDVPERT